MTLPTNDVLSKHGELANRDEKHMTMDGNELLLNDLEIVSGGFVVGGPVR